MNVLPCSPYRLDKNLGKAYNETMALLPDDWWAAFHDIDTCFLTPESIAIIHKYIELYPSTGIFTCFTNRLSTLSTKQLLNGKISEDMDMRNHIAIAQVQKSRLYTTYEVKKDISGMLMVISKATWKRFPFKEDKKCLGVDTEYNRRLRASGRKILRMEGLYIFHIYRIENGINNKSHLL